MLIMGCQQIEKSSDESKFLANYVSKFRAVELCYGSHTAPSSKPLSSGFKKFWIILT